mmetsp:Transcript_18455/g.58261  ORF Transcript_18455/g.58261 Transcript_18455/m.58261 type:complete len:402 (+) Transcript_18455:52-1257(+)
MWCLNDDPCGIICACMTHGLIVFANFAMVYGVLLPWLGWTAPAALHYAAFATISLLAELSHLRAMTTNPGAVPLGCPPPPGTDESKSRVPVCHRCEGYKPPRAHHCSQCNRCILKMDHHCPWVNNCVGQNNQKHFVLFLSYTLTLSAYALTLLAIRAATSVGMDGSYKRGRYSAILKPAYAHAGRPLDDAGPVLVNCILFFEAILFGLFTSAMLTDQLTSILNDTTAIERLKKEESGRERGPDQDTCLFALSETFGRPCSLSWLVPTSVKFNGLTYEELSGSDLYEHYGVHDDRYDALLARDPADMGDHDDSEYEEHMHRSSRTRGDYDCPHHEHRHAHEYTVADQARFGTDVGLAPGEESGDEDEASVDTEVIRRGEGGRGDHLARSINPRRHRLAPSQV